MIAAILSVFVLATAAPALHRLLRGATAWVLALPVLAVTCYFAVAGGFRRRRDHGEPAHMIGRAAYLLKVPFWKGMADELKNRYSDDRKALRSQ